MLSCTNIYTQNFGFSNVGSGSLLPLDQVQNSFVQEDTINVLELYKEFQKSKRKENVAPISEEIITYSYEYALSNTCPIMAENVPGRSPLYYPSCHPEIKYTNEIEARRAAELFRQNEILKLDSFANIVSGNNEFNKDDYSKDLSTIDSLIAEKTDVYSPTSTDSLFVQFLNSLFKDIDKNSLSVYSAKGQARQRNNNVKKLEPTDDLIINAETINKSLNASALMQWPLKKKGSSKKTQSKDIIVAVSAKVQAEKDFANIFSGGDISSTGGLGLTFGYGNLPDSSEFNTDYSVINESENYHLWYLSGNVDFTKLVNVVNPLDSFKKETITDTHWSIRAGYNQFFKKADLLSGISITAGNTNNISQLTKQKARNFIQSPDTAIVFIQDQDVLTGVYQEISFFNISLDFLYTPRNFKNIALFANVNYNYFDIGNKDLNDDVDINLGIIFRKYDKTEKRYSNSFGFVFGWDDVGNNIKLENEKGNFRFGITTTYSLNAFNKSSPPKQQNKS